MHMAGFSWDKHQEVGLVISKHVFYLTRSWQSIPQSCPYLQATSNVNFHRSSSSPLPYWQLIHQIIFCSSYHVWNCTVFVFFSIEKMFKPTERLNDTTWTPMRSLPRFTMLYQPVEYLPSFFCCLLNHLKVSCKHKDISA